VLQPVRIASSPVQARVSVNGKHVGETPISGLRWNPGSYRIQITKKGFAGKDSVVVIGTLDAGRPLALFFRLEHEAQLAAGMYIATVPASDQVLVTIDGIPQVGAEPYEVQLHGESKQLLVKVRLGKQVWEKAVTVSRGEVKRLTVDFTKKVALALSVYAQTASGVIDTTRHLVDCQVYIDGEKVASSTPARIVVFQGKHTVVAEHNKFGQSTPVVANFTSDQNVRLVVDPSRGNRTGIVRLVVEPSAARNATILMVSEGKEQRIGNAPIGLKLWVGECTIIARQEGFLDVSRTITVSEGKEIKLQLKMTPRENNRKR
jgi:hypothetical protein